jgi:hypothetical protein
MGGDFEDPSGSHGQRANMLDWVDKWRKNQKTTRGEAIIALLCELAPSPNYRKRNKPRRGSPEIPNRESDFDWPATEEELKKTN